MKASNTADSKLKKKVAIITADQRLFCQFMRENAGKKRVLANNCLKSSNNEPLCKRDRVQNTWLRPPKKEREKKREIDDFGDERSFNRFLRERVNL